MLNTMFYCVLQLRRARDKEAALQALLGEKENQLQVVYFTPELTALSLFLCLFVCLFVCSVRLCV